MIFYCVAHEYGCIYATNALFYGFIIATFIFKHLSINIPTIYNSLLIIHSADLALLAQKLIYGIVEGCYENRHAGLW